MRLCGHVSAAGVWAPVCLLACAHSPTVMQEDGEDEPNSVLLKRCQGGDLQTCMSLTGNQLYASDWSGPSRRRPELLEYAEPAAMEACRLNPAACEPFLWVLDAMEYSAQELLKTGRVVAHLEEACGWREYPDACDYLGGSLPGPGSSPRRLVPTRQGVACWRSATTPNAAAGCSSFTGRKSWSGPARPSRRCASASKRSPRAARWMPRRLKSSARVGQLVRAHSKSRSTRWSMSEGA
jgi:hypothetical protein